MITERSTSTPWNPERVKAIGHTDRELDPSDRRCGECLCVNHLYAALLALLIMDMDKEIARIFSLPLARRDKGTLSTIASLPEEIDPDELSFAALMTRRRSRGVVEAIFVDPNNLKR